MKEKWLSNYAATKDGRDVQFLLERKLIDSIDAEGILRKNKVLEVFDGFKVFSKDDIKQFQGDSDTQVDLDEIGSELENDDVTVEDVWLMKKFESKLAKYSLEGSYYRLGSALFYGTGRKDYFVWLNEDEGDIRVKQRFLPLELRLALEHLVLALVCLCVLPIEFYYGLSAIIHTPLCIYNSVKRLYYKKSAYIFWYTTGVLSLVILIGLTRLLIKTGALLG
nr:MAG TPA: hypothetical protein [Caudoviricetes sp.]